MLAARRLHRVLPYYVLALVPGAVAVVGLSVLIETSHQFSIRAAYGPDLTLYSIPFTVTSPLPWITGIVFAAGGLWLFLRAARLARNSYDEAVAGGRDA